MQFVVVLGTIPICCFIVAIAKASKLSGSVSCIRFKYSFAVSIVNFVYLLVSMLIVCIIIVGYSIPSIY